MSLVTVIIPCFNYGWILSETLNSLLQQTHQQWEALIIDDGSTDNTKEVATKYVSSDHRFRYIYQKNAGLSEARNTGLRQAQGAYIQLLDADDLLASRKLETQVAYLEKHIDVDLVYGEVRYFLHGNLSVLSRSFDMLDQTWMYRPSETGEGLLEALVRRNIMVVNAPLLRANLVKSIGFFNPKLRSYEDWEYWLRGALLGAKMHFESVPDMWVFVRVHPGSMTQNSQIMSSAILQVRYMLANALKKKHLLLANEEGIRECYLGIAQRNMLSGSLVLGVQSFLALAKRSGQYRYYLKSIPFWLIKRLKNNYFS